MRALLLLALTACSNDVDPRVIPGGGVGDGDIDGEVNVYVIDASTELPIASATVEVAGEQLTTDATGLAVFKDVDGPQTIAVKAATYRSTVWVGVNGANVTIPMPATRGTPDSAMLSGTIQGWETLTVPNGHLKVALVLFSWSNRIGDGANDIQTPNNTNVCLGQTCNWSISSRTGQVTLTALIADLDPKGNLDPSDDTRSVIGYAFKTGIIVEKGVNQSGLVLTQVEAGNLETATIDKGTPPAALTELAYLVGIEIDADETVQLPTFVQTEPTTMLVPRPVVFGPDATYRLTAIAQTTSGNMGAQSIVLRQDLPTAALAAGTWLNTPTGVTVTRTSASWMPVTGATVHSVAWSDATGPLLEISVWDAKSSAVEVPTLVALPASGTLTARVQGIGADLDPNDFSLEEDSGLLWGVSAQPMAIP